MDYKKSLVYADKSETIDVSEENIRLILADIRRQLLQNKAEIFPSVEFIRASRGDHLPQINFET